MELLHLPTVDSTSTHASQLLAAGKQAPFMVWADCQTAGRGRRGSPWQSASGNLYTTLVLPAEPVANGMQGLLSLKAGVIAARLVQRYFGLRLTLKWPNDLLFGGAKIGGLLLESSLSGGQMGELLIGLGLNLSEAPQLPSPYQAVALRDVLGRRTAVADFARYVQTAWLPAWRELDLTAVAAAYTEYAIPCGELWRHEVSGELAALVRLGSDASLLLQPLRGGDERVLTSADHGWRWLHQYRGEAAPLPLLLADVGNTAVKLAVFTGQEQAATSVEQWPARHRKPIWSRPFAA